MVRQRNFNVVEVKKDFPLEALIDTMRCNIYRKNAHSDIKAVKKYAEAATELYDRLVKPVVQYLSNTVIIVPDGVLGYLPFEALLTEKPTEITRPATYKYMLYNHRVSYAYSATLLSELKKNKRPADLPLDLLAAFAPFSNGQIAVLEPQKYDSRRDSLSTLPFSGDEINELIKIMKSGKPFLGKAATKKLIFEQRLESAHRSRRFTRCFGR
ncbi:MAG: CHAT domain-containing protein [Saprospiraceae bacterium]|nr:CHAT domain-containing protein [Saprospiraceae bacterium]